MFQQRRNIFALVLLVALAVVVCRAQDDDYDGYGSSNQGDNEGYHNGYSGDENYNGNTPNYQQNVDPEGSNSNPSSYSSQGGSDADGDYEGDDSSSAASEIKPSVVRVRRSAGVDDQKVEASAPKLRVKRHGKYYIGPVYTYVKTDKHANFKWGVKHKVGKKHYG